MFHWYLELWRRELGFWILQLLGFPEGNSRELHGMLCMILDGKIPQTKVLNIHDFQYSLYDIHLCSTNEYR